MGIQSEIDRIVNDVETIKNHLNTLGLQTSGGLRGIADSISLIIKPRGRAGQVVGFVEDDVIGAVNVVGEKGDKGDKGDNGITPNISVEATINNSVGVPSVNVSKSGTVTNPIFEFQFQNIKGESGSGSTITPIDFSYGVVSGFYYTIGDFCFVYGYIYSSGNAEINVRLSDNSSFPCPKKGTSDAFAPALAIGCTSIAGNTPILSFPAYIYYWNSPFLRVARTSSCSYIHFTSTYRFQ